MDWVVVLSVYVLFIIGCFDIAIIYILLNPDLVPFIDLLVCPSEPRKQLCLLLLTPRVASILTDASGFSWQASLSPCLPAC